MMGQQPRTESLFYYFRLEEQIPADHLLRLIDGYVDFSFVREQLKCFYSATGRPHLRSRTRAFPILLPPVSGDQTDPDGGMECRAEQGDFEIGR
jgi:hypothetical protein